MNEKLERFFLDVSEPQRSCLQAIRSIILEQDTGISESVKYGMPCFLFQKKAICYLWIDKKTHEPYILMVDGQLLNHPDLEKGNRSRMKILRVNPNTDIPEDTIKNILRQAINFANP